MNTPSLQYRYDSAKATLDAVGQSHALHFWSKLDDDDKDQLLRQIDAIDWPEVARLIQSHVLNKPQFTLPTNVAPAPWYPYVAPKGQKKKYTEARKLGEKLLREGKVAAFTVAGGQGTRLGWDGPKGTFPATAIRKIALFECMAEFIRKSQEKFKTTIPWYIMTSPINHSATRAFFDKHGYFGLEPDNVSMFPQAMMPAIDAVSGKVLLESPASLALSPNGHGGSLKALYAGAEKSPIADMKRRGIEQISYTQVDNPIVRVLDPQFIGLHASDGCQMSSKMLPKREPLEKLGNFCLVDGKMTVIEYSDLPETLARETLANGELRFRAGSIALHCIRVDFVEFLNTRPEGFGLPFHRADKKVPFVDLNTGQEVKPPKNNAVKLETFVFDALPMTDKSIIYETDRLEEFAPIKNADTEPPAAPAQDSPNTSKQLQSERAAKWLEAYGVKVARDPAGKVAAVIEIPQTTAIEASDLKGLDLPETIEAGTEVLL